ncbi:MAG: hypothetical protein P4L46_10635 [Fimbriimonas sp.]|nr:hypothetical protein [Fimbriimonas sp.]
MIPTVLASAKLVASYAAVAPSLPTLVPAMPGGMGVPAVSAPKTAAQTAAKPAAPPPKLRFIESGYFDAGYEKLIGVFSDQIIHAGVRYGQDDLTGFFRNTTLDTRGTGLPYPQAVQGTTIGIAARHWFPGNQMFATVETGDTIAGPFSGRTDTRYGMVGYTNWTHDKAFTDVYGELFYIALQSDTFADLRFRSGQILTKDKDGNYFWLYLVGQGWISGRDTVGTENRVEAGPGLAYVFKKLNLSVNLEMRGGYSFKGSIPDKSFFNPTLIVSTGWDK